MDATGWRAWYADGGVYDSAGTDPEDLPEDGCLYVVVYTGLETPKRGLHSGEDIYFWWDSPEGLVVGSNSHPREENERRYPGAVVVRGKWTTLEHMARVRAEALASEAP